MQNPIFMLIPFCQFKSIVQRFYSIIRGLTIQEQAQRIPRCACHVCDYMVISFLPLILKNAASAMIVEKVRMAEMAEATPSLPRMIWE